MVTKYYAVVCGLVPGIYTDWPTTESMVKGYPGAIFKSFRTRAEAEAFMAKSTAISTNVETQKQPHVLPLTNRTIIYTDGSFVKGIGDDPGTCGFGIVIITSAGEKLKAYGRVPDTAMTTGPTNNVAELYAIYVALSLVKGDVILYSDSQYAITSLTTYVHGWIQNGRAGVSNRILIEGTYGLIAGRDVTLQHVDAHTGIELNEEADRLANEGRIQSENLIVFKNDIRIV